MAKARGRTTRIVPMDDFEAEIDQEAEELAKSEALTDNAIDVPIFADTDGRSLRSITQLRLHKLEPGGPPAYKGMIPLNSTFETIGHVYGDGIYTIEGLNAKHTVLASKDNVRISLTPIKDQRQLELLPGASEPDRIERLARASAIESQTNTKEFIQLILASTQAQAERERNFTAAQQKQQADFFAGMMSMSQQGFQQMMTMMQSGHAMTIQALNATQEERSNPLQAAELLLKGINIGRDFEGNTPPAGDRPFWQDILQNGIGLLADTKARTSGQGLASSLSTPLLPTSLTPNQQRELVNAVKLYKKVRAKGIDPNKLLARLSQERPQMPDSEPELDPDVEPEEADEELEGEDEDEETDEESEAMEQANHLITKHGRRTKLSDGESEDFG